MEKKAKILLIDDNETNVLLVNKILDTNGYAVTSVYHSREALDILRNGSFDLVLLDIMMPEMDGFEVLDFIKKDLKLQTPVVMLTACHEKRYIDKAFESGATDYLKKPARKKELLDMIEKILGETVPEEIKKSANGSWFDKYFGSAIKSFSKRKTILVVDDNVSDVILLEHALEEKKYKVISAHDGKKALQMLREEKPDLVILDILLPGMDGLEVLGRMRKMDTHVDTSVIVVSCIHEHTYIQKAMESNIESYVTKPYRLNKLVALIEEVLREKTGKPAKNIKILT